MTASMTKLALASSLILISSTFIFTGCGGSSDPAKTTTPTDEISTQVYQSQTIPTEISIEIPPSLKSDREITRSLRAKTSRDETDTQHQSIGYIQLKNQINNTESMISDLKHNLLFLDSLMPQIETLCENTPTNEMCQIEEGLVTLMLDQTLINGVYEIINEQDPTEAEALKKEMQDIVNTQYPMGAITYTQFDENNTFTQSVEIDMKPLSETFETGIIKDTQKVKWSKDQNKIVTSNSYEDTDINTALSLQFSKQDGGKRLMRIENDFIDKYADIEFNLVSTFEDTNDSNHTINITSLSQTTMPSFDDNMSDTNSSFTYNTKGKVSDHGGYLETEGTAPYIGEFREKERFDANGNLEKSASCYPIPEIEIPDDLPDDIELPQLGCNLDDESTWFTNDQTFLDDIEPTTFNDLNVTGDLQEGVYHLVPADITLDTEEIYEVFENRVGEIFVFSDEVYGVLFDNNYSDVLENLSVVYEVFNEESGELTYTVLEGAQRPTLTIQ
ncbi:MAG: hypothetical protein K0U47_01465 [Epsilonproteobacteria bacterium]|nr:hypothetical protein [Campylobacterota bacterium]